VSLKYSSIVLASLRSLFIMAADSWTAEIGEQHRPLLGKGQPLNVGVNRVVSPNEQGILYLTV